MTKVQLMNMIDEFARKAVCGNCTVEALHEEMAEILMTVMTCGDASMCELFKVEFEKLKKMMKILTAQGHPRTSEVNRQMEVDQLRHQYLLAFYESEGVEVECKGEWDKITDPVVRPYMRYMEMVTCRAIH